MAPALSVIYACLIYQGVPIVVCFDNQGPNGPITKGPRKTLLGREIVPLIWRIAGESASHIWLEFVRSHLNVADEPPRCCGSLVAPGEFAEHSERVHLPHRFFIALAPREALISFGLPDGVQSTLTAWPCFH